ncbi:MAG: hypothetical protein Q8M26_10335 [Pseudolabrys sp.]|nr:hypothetical protein [Pseudolabrys sp.]
MVTAAAGQLLGRVLRICLVAAVIGIAALIAIYHFTIAATLALELQYGLINARLIIGGIYGTVALIALIVFWAMRRKTAEATAPALAPQHQMQLAMLVEAGLLGYALARKDRVP